MTHLTEDVRGFLYAIMGADTWLEAGTIWDKNPEQRKAAHTALSPASLPLGVKELEWQEPTGRGAYKSGFFTTWRARPDQDIYYVIRYAEHNPDAPPGYRTKPYEPYYSNGNGGHFSTLEEAKAAAQADFNARISSALKPIEPERISEAERTIGILLSRFLYDNKRSDMTYSEVMACVTAALNGAVK